MVPITFSKFNTNAYDGPSLPTQPQPQPQPQPHQQKNTTRGLAGDIGIQRFNHHLVIHFLLTRAPLGCERLGSCIIVAVVVCNVGALALIFFFCSE